MSRSKRTLIRPLDATNATRMVDSILVGLSAYCALILEYGVQSLPTSTQIILVTFDMLLANLICSTVVVKNARSAKPLPTAVCVTLLVSGALQGATGFLALSLEGRYGASLHAWLSIWSALACVLMIGSTVMQRLLRRFRGSRVTRYEAVAIAAQGISEHQVRRSVGAAVESGIDPVIVYDENATSSRINLFNVAITDKFESFVDAVRSRNVREVWVLTQTFQMEALESFVSAFRNDFVNIRLFPVIDRTFFTEPTAIDFKGMPAINIVSLPWTFKQRASKAIFDRLFALTALALAALPMIFISLAVKFSSPGPVFFRQRRRGADGTEFSIFKFRTMYQHVEHAGVVTQARKHDPRVTPIGAFLRRTSLDELPQFLNVLLGDMSVVGPRPHATEHDELYKEIVDKYMYRYRIKPGITGLAQVNGFRGETERVEKMKGRVDLDLDYIRNWTLRQDLKIVFLTAMKVFSDKGAF